MTDIKTFDIEIRFKEELGRAAESAPAGSGADESRSQRAPSGSSILRDARLLLVNDVPAEVFYVVRLREEAKLQVSVVTSTADA